MSKYIYVEYPKCLYQGTPEQCETVTVWSRTEEDACAKEGWVTADVFHATVPTDSKKKKK